MTNPAENDVVAIATHLRRLLDPARSTQDQARSILELGPAVCETLTAIYGLDEGTVIAAADRAYASEMLAN